MTTLLSFFDAAYVINLPERVDRQKSARREFERAGWGPGAVQFFPARRFSDRAGFSNAAMRGCYHSHLDCLREAMSRGYKNVLILEDDIATSPALPRLTPAILTNLHSTPWDFVFFGHENTGEIGRARSDIAAEEFHFRPWNEDIFAAHFYGVGARIIPRLIEFLERCANADGNDPLIKPMPLDGAYNVFRRTNPDVRTVIAIPKLGWQRPSRSDITPKWIDRSAALRPALTILREVKHFASWWRP